MPRLFTAIEVPREIGERLALLRGGLPGARWIDVENYHLTLSFIGDIDDAAARDAAEALDGVRRPAFSLEIDGLDAFGGARPKTVYARVVPSPALMELQAAQERLLRRLGLKLENRQYTPHVTLARLRGEATARLTADWLATRGGARHGFPVERFVLMSSRDSVGGGPYIVEETYGLEGAEGPGSAWRSE
jgi:2'-5' RNA ligase